MSTRWTDEQLAAIEEQRAELALSAAAGSGKTAVLIERVLRAVLGSAEAGTALDISRLLAVTFTRAAAAELRERLQRALEQELAARRRAGLPLSGLREQLAALPLAQISTLHSFCLDVLRRHGHQLGLSAGRILGDDEAGLLRHSMASELLDRALGDDWTPLGLPPLRELALAWGGEDGIGPPDLSRVRAPKGLRQLLLKLHDFRCSLPGPQAWFAAVRRAPLDPAQFDPDSPGLAPLKDKLRAWCEAEIAQGEALAARLREVLPGAVYAALLDRRAALLRSLSLELGWEGLRAQLAVFKEKSEFKGKPTYEGVSKSDLKEYPELGELVEQNSKELKKGLNGWRALFGQSYESFERVESAANAQIETLWQLALRFDEEYSEHKRSRGLLDYSDLERYAVAILFAGRGADGALLPSEAALELRARFGLVLVDEYQDTSPIQDAILELVTPDAPAADPATGLQAGGRPRFMVGDLKQSIYAFRLAQPRLFTAHQQRLEALPHSAGRRLRLSRNFRSRPRILQAINALFLGLMNDGLGGEDYAQNQLQPGLDYSAIFAQAGVEPSVDLPAGLHLVEVDPKGEAAEEAATAAAEAADSDGEGEAAPDTDEPLAVSEAVYRRTASLLAQIHAEGQPVYDKAAGAVRPVDWRDMAVLLRTTAGRIELLKNELERAGVPCYAPGRSGFFERTEIADALALLRVVDNPRQDIALAAVLHGPAVQLSPEQLLAVSQPELGQAQERSDSERAAQRVLRDPLWSRLQRYCETGSEVALKDRLLQFSAQMAGWRRLGRTATLPELLAQLLHESGLRPAAAALSDGGQRLANLRLLEDLAREFSGFERQGLPRFLEFLKLSRRAAGDLGEAPLLSESANVVRVMSVHQSKGLEFPVVVLPDIQRQFNLLDLRGDVLWHREAGIGGRFVDLRAQPPRRADSLALLAAREARQADSVSEELRILYVALTRARERLELVGAVKPGFIDKLKDEHKGQAARSWLDWIGPQLAAGIRSAAQGETAAAAAAESANEAGAGWRIEYLRGLASLPPAETTGAAWAPLSAEAAAQIERRLGFRYAYPQAFALPAKITVTRLAKQASAVDAAETHVWLDEERAPQASLVQPRLLRLEAPAGQAAAASAADIGSATHALLAALDWAGPQSMQRLEQLREQLVASGRLDEQPARGINLDSILRMAQELQPRLTAPGVRLYRELPVALLVGPAEYAAAAGPAESAAGGPAKSAAAGYAPGDRVYVQGVIDLLAVGPDGALLLDYKTDRGASADELLARYRRQLSWYARAAAGLLPRLEGAAIRWALYGLGGAGLLGPFAYGDPGT